ncbi:MAG: hypothetical protein GYA02_13085 [Clostridiaceae bacterium]|nr:hypothetical protein [Clostridiaceae bacterium]
MCSAKTNIDCLSINEGKIINFPDRDLFTKYFDENWVQGRGKDYTVTVTVEEENLNSGSLVSINISAQRTKPYPFIKKGGQDIYSVDSKKFFPLTGGAYE